MTPSPHSVGIDQSLKVATDLMHRHAIRHLPVRDGGELVGVITERDINFALAMDKKSAESVTVEQAYTAEIYAVAPGEKLSTVADYMAANGLGCALIVEENKELIGIFTSVDACRELARLTK
jgi:acetoin utilization protein AcuB